MAGKGSQSTYIACRKHPKAGLLFKVGVTQHVYGRCIALCAKLVVGGLPETLERELLAELDASRVWRKNEQGEPVGPMPMFHAPSEWFYPSSEVLGRIEQLVREPAR